MNRKMLLYGALGIFLFTLVFIFLIEGCAPKKPQPVTTGLIKDEEYGPDKWGEVYPLQYESWLKTKEPRQRDLSRFKRGWDVDKIVWDKLSEFPYMPLLFKGWGFGIEYNEPRGHYYMMIDQAEIDQSRTRAGGVCLTCKSPYMAKLYKENGKDLFKMPYKDAVNKIPENHRSLGVACIDCHDNKTLEIKWKRWTLDKGLMEIGKTEFSRQEKRLVVCAQCHVTYYIPKNEAMQSTDVLFPWKGSTWGDISIENIIKVLLSNPANREWKQEVTGFKMPFIRHPEFEFYTNRSVHFKAGLACADCHLPYKRVGSYKITDHNIMSPLKDDLRACAACHPQANERLKARIFAIQERTVSLLNRAGYATATVAKLFETTHAQQKNGKAINMSLYNRAKEFYEEAFLRGVFIGAENSVGFHNPSEAGRILGDSIAFAQKAEALLRQALTQAGVQVPEVVNLELAKYLNGRGTKKLNFRPEQEIKDPYGTQKRFLPDAYRGI